MNAQEEIDRLLAQSGAVLIRQNKHLVYRLPNGRNFVAAKTSSDPERAAKNGLSDLRRALGAVGTVIRKEQIAMEHPQEANQSHSNPQTGAPAPPLAAASPGGHNALRSRLESMIAQEEIAQERLLGEAQQLERRVQMLKALLPFADDPVTEAALKAIAGAPLPPSPAPGAPEPPQLITEHVQVTRQLVFAATQTFEDMFTINDVLALMTGDRPIAAEERLRVRQAIAHAMKTLWERGELVKEEGHYGRHQSVWRKADLNGHGIGVGTRA